MRLFDSHCHLDDKQYNRDFKGVLKRAAAAGVECMLTVGVSHKGSSQAVSLAESNPGVYASVGVHPHYARQCGGATLEILIKLAKSAKVKAWGEIGLDFNRLYSPRVLPLNAILCGPYPMPRSRRQQTTQRLLLTR